MTWGPNNRGISSLGGAGAAEAAGPPNPGTLAVWLGVSVGPSISGPTRPGVVQATKKGAPIRGAAPRRGGLKSWKGNITVFEVFRYLVERSFSSHKLRSSFSRRQWQLALCAPASLRPLVFSDYLQCHGLSMAHPPDTARRRTRRRSARSTRRSCFSGRGPTPRASFDRVRKALGPLGMRCVAVE